MGLTLRNTELFGSLLRLLRALISLGNASSAAVTRHTRIASSSSADETGSGDSGSWRNDSATSLFKWERLVRQREISFDTDGRDD